MRKFIVLFHYVGLYLCCKDEKTKEYKNPYNTYLHVIDYFILALQLFVLIPFFPYVTIIAPLFLTIEFAMERMILCRYSQKPAITQFKNVCSHFKKKAYWKLHRYPVQYDNVLRRVCLVNVLCSSNSSF